MRLRQTRSSVLPMLSVALFGCASAVKAPPMERSQSTDKVFDAGPAPCASSVDCSDEDAPVCTAPRCRACAGPRDDADCAARDPAAPRCDATSGRCAACRVDTQATDCAAAQAPICDGGRCRGCRAHDECASQVWNPDGSCADASAVLYVDAGSCNATIDGTAAHPFCQIQDALDALVAQPLLRSRRYVRVAGGPIQYTAIRVLSNVSIIGPGRAQPAAVVRGSLAAPGLVVQAASVATVDGLEITGGAGGVVCNGNASLTLRRCNVHDVKGIGLLASHCTLDADSNTITGASGGGVNVSVSDYSLTNNFIVANGPTGRGVQFDDLSGDGTFAFNTVVDNHYVDAPQSGIDCGSGAARLIAAAIVWRNGHDPGVSQMIGNCRLRDVVTGMDPFDGALQMDPALRAPGPPDWDYHLKPGDPANLACCVDRVRGGPDGGGGWDLVDHDVDFRARPLGAGWDVGAHELQ